MSMLAEEGKSWCVGVKRTDPSVACIRIGGLQRCADESPHGQEPYLCGLIRGRQVPRRHRSPDLATKVV